jgi:TonB family protein
MFRAVGSIAGLLTLALIEAVTVIGPAYPPNAIAGGTVVAVLHVSAGSVNGIDILQGDDPFIAPVRSALGGWRFKDSEESDILVAVDFRSPSLYPIGSPTRNIAPAHAVLGMAYPEKLVDPAYPSNSLAEGSVVLDIEISETGSVSKVKVLQGAGGITDACVSAVKDWLFAPARNKQGVAVTSKAYAVCVVRRPVLSKRMPR